MCGILGIINHKQPIDTQLLFNMTETLKHRGPDGEGYLIGSNSGDYVIRNSKEELSGETGNIALGHRRLTIIDFSTGSQPMTNEDGRIVITFNGEIYNFQELRSQLQALGHKFSTDHSDTETIIHAYEQWGPSCLEQLRGMFAFGILDLDKKHLFLARDRLGKKPLYYYVENGKFVFASELKAILEDRTIPRQIDPSALTEYLLLGYIVSPKTIFKNIYKLEPGHFVFKNIESLSRSIEQEIYWKADYKPDFTKKEDDWAAEVEHGIRESVKLRMISDAPLGAFLSGGLDSTCIVSMMAKQSSKKIKTFSIGFKEKDYSETKYARQVAEKYDTDHYEQIVTPNAFELLPKLAWQYDEPFGDSSAIPTYYVSKMAREHITVALSGDGGDEIFAGYSRYTQALDYLKADRIPSVLKPAVGLIAGLYPDWVKGKGFLTRISLNEKERFYSMLSSKVYSRMLDRSGYAKDVDNPLERHWNSNLDDYISQMQYLDVEVYLPEDILVKVDRASMLCSLEARAPLIDHKVVELLGRIPSNFKIKNGSKKYILKKIMKDDWNEDFLERKKMGFGVPLQYWFKEKDFEPLLNETILSEKSFISNFISRQQVSKLVDGHLKGQRDFSSDIWRILFLEEWARIWKPSL